MSRCKTRSRVLGLSFGHESIPLQTHAFTRSFIYGTAIEIGITKSDIGLALLEQRRVVQNSSPSVRTHAMSGLLVEHPE